MADIEKVRVGDTLRIDVEVLNLDRGDEQFPIEIKPKDSETCWIRRTTVEAAEHIPAPKVFKRGDWVRQSDWKPQREDAVSNFLKAFAPKPRRHGWVTGTVASSGNVLVNWPQEPHNLESVSPEFLEHDEAPE